MRSHRPELCAQPSRRTQAHKKKPRVLEVPFGDHPSRKELARAFGRDKEDRNSESWLAINRDGANGIQNTDDRSDVIA